MTEETITIPKNCKVTNAYGLHIIIDNFESLLKVRDLEVNGEKVDVRVNIEGVIKDFTFEQFMMRLGFAIGNLRINEKIKD